MKRSKPGKSSVEAKTPVAAEAAGGVRKLDPVDFRSRLMAWYSAQARTLPWRGTTDPYLIWVSEIMLQQTRVSAVVDYYNEFVRRFPTLVSLALAAEPDVLAAWSGLGYYRRARMLHKAARFIMLERDGRLPTNSTDLRTLPGIGEYTAAAIASIAFGEPAAVVDGNVERVIFRVAGRPNAATASDRAFVRMQAQALMPQIAEKTASTDAGVLPEPSSRPRKTRAWDTADRIALAAKAHPTALAGGDLAYPHLAANPAGDHNQAMMELGATICLPRSPLCSECPVRPLCRTQGEHATPSRATQRSVAAALLLDLRKRGPTTEVLLSLRPAKASVMPAMFELPSLPVDATEGREPVLRVRHAITNTNYYVQVFSSKSRDEQSDVRPLRRAVPKDSGDLHWVNVTRLAGLPLTGLARKVLQRLRVMESARISLLEN